MGTGLRRDSAWDCTVHTEGTNGTKANEEFHATDQSLTPLSNGVLKTVLKKDVRHGHACSEQVLFLTHSAAAFQTYLKSVEETDCHL